MRILSNLLTILSGEEMEANTNEMLFASLTVFITLLILSINF